MKVGLTIGSKAPSLPAQLPPTQAVVGPHAVEQPPQWFGSVLVSKQPVGQQVCEPVQAGPPLQVLAALQVLATQVSPAGHAAPQPPQFLGSVAVLAHPVGQHCWDAAQVGPPLQVRTTHAPLTHRAPGAQAMLQPPQLFGSVMMSTQPLGQHSSVPVHTWPPLHCTFPTHMPSRQPMPAPQGMLQPPQLFWSMVVSTQPPFGQQFSEPGQLGPPLQPGLQVLAEHESPAGQALLQPPQLFESLVVSVQPFAQHCCEPAQAGPPLHEA
jgi:hypothetical protein